MIKFLIQTVRSSITLRWYINWLSYIYQCHIGNSRVMNDEFANMKKKKTVKLS